MLNFTYMYSFFFLSTRNKVLLIPANVYPDVYFRHHGDHFVETSPQDVLKKAQGCLSLGRLYLLS